MEFNAYHFVGKTLRDGSPIPQDGETLRWTGDLAMCQSGLHASRKAWQALEYAVGHILCRVHCRDDIIEGSDKLVCRERTITSRIDASPVLWAFARKCALDVAHFWPCPPIVTEYLKTGDKEKRATATAAVRDARATGWAAKSAAWAAGANRDGRDARHAVWWPMDACDARDAVWAARAAVWAVRDATANAAQAAARANQRRALTRMVNAAFAA